MSARARFHAFRQAEELKTPPKMANPDHVQTLRQGVDVWNDRREREPLITPDLSDAHLSRANLIGADLSGADLPTGPTTRPPAEPAGPAPAAELDEAEYVVWYGTN